ncbi:MAG: hypothetical protein R3247_10405 [Rhodothermales bacterium]|nr:hypothetical protein [Rhodothermales bacterium]
MKPLLLLLLLAVAAAFFAAVITATQALPWYYKAFGAAPFLVALYALYAALRERAAPR